jgi:hypothetical protein
MRVVDGMHRVRAAQRRGDTRILAKFFDGSELDAFVYAVRINVKHGMLLSRDDREAAAARIIAAYAHWSDRAIATATGLSAPTVSAIRRRSADAVEKPPVRIGRDGRARPLSTAEGRRKASRLMAEHPNASLRQIARESGISVGTVRDVRERVRRGEDPVPPRYAMTGGRPRSPAVGQASTGARHDPSAVSAERWQRLRENPSLRLTEHGRFLLRSLGVQAVAPRTRSEIVHSVPEYCGGMVAALARGCSKWWTDFAEELTERSASVD